jgi:SAM-dependent methyltransferase
MADAGTSSTEQDWEEQARNWVAWARRPEFDSYWRYQAEFFRLIPEPVKATLDLGCGEGRISRELRARGHDVTGVDASPTLIAAAHEADPIGRYMVADATALPFADGDFDLIVSYNVLMDVSDVDQAVAEAARVLAKGGRFVVALTHPVTNAGRPLDDSPGAPFVIDGSYFTERRVAFDEEGDGLRMRFSGWDRPLSAYTGALERAGLLIEALREPVSVTRHGTDRPVPFHLWIRALRPPW